MSKGVFAPLLAAQFLPTRSHTTLLVLKQFGTGVIMSTSLVHVSRKEAHQKKIKKFIFINLQETVLKKTIATPFSS